MSVLLLGGTAEARALAVRLVDDDVAVLSSLAGRVDNPRLPVGEVRIGGFGGVPGLQTWLRENRTAAVVDATHPFAATISAHAALACAAEGVPLLRLQRRGWEIEPGARDWHWVDDHASAAETAMGLGDRPFLTVGRQSLGDFVAPLTAAAALVRTVDAPDLVLPEAWELLLARGPYTLEGEKRLMTGHRTDVLVTKDSGGELTRAKLSAAEELRVPVVVVRRPEPPAGVATVSTIDEVLAWLRER